MPTEAELTLVETALVDAAQKPQSASSDGQSVSEHSLADLIALDKYLAWKLAAAQPGRGLRFTKLKPPGTV